MTQEQGYIGIDVLKATLEVAVRPHNKTWTVPNDEAAISALIADLKRRQLALIGLESTGGLELPCVAALAAAQWPVVVVNPRQVLGFRQSEWPIRQDRSDGCRYLSVVWASRAS